MSKAIIKISIVESEGEILNLWFVVGRNPVFPVLKLFDAFAKPPHEFRDLFAAKQQKDSYYDNYNFWCS